MISHLRLQQFRSYDDKKITLSPAVTIISGPNGSGKTNLLEGLYVAARGSSFRGADTDILKTDTDWWRLDASLEEGSSPGG